MADKAPTAAKTLTLVDIESLPRRRRESKYHWPINEWTHAIPIGKGADVTEQVKAAGATPGGFQSSANKLLRPHGLMVRVHKASGKVYIIHPETLPPPRKRTPRKPKSQ